MKHLLRLNSCPQEGISIEDKHSKFASALLSLAGPWGLKEGAYPPPDPGIEVSAHFSLGPNLRQRGVKGFVNYRFRGGLRPDSSCDDYVALEFNPARVEFRSLAESALLEYIKAFEPYFGYLANEEFIFADFKRSRNLNLRARILRLYPTCYVSREISEQALHMSLDDVINRLADKPVSIQRVADGILIRANSDVVDFAAEKKLSDELSVAVGLSLE